LVLPFPALAVLSSLGDDDVVGCPAGVSAAAVPGDCEAAHRRLCLRVAEAELVAPSDRDPETGVGQRHTCRGNEQQPTGHQTGSYQLKRTLHGP
jgi:hypothetical protein